MAEAPEVPFDHHSPEYADNWAQITRDMRSKCPVTHTSAWGGFYALTTYQEVADVIRDDATFSSARKVPGVPEDQIVGITIPAAPQGSIPIDLDPPNNAPYRKLLNPIFSPARSRAWEPFLRDVTTECINRFIESGSADFVEALANPIPALLTCQLMGLPLEDWRVYAEPMHEVVYTPPDSPRWQGVIDQMFTMLERIAAAVEQRKAEPRDDLITTLVQARIDGKPIPDPVIYEILNLVLVGGVDTTTSLMANAFIWLAQHPEERARLRKDPSLMPAAREEFLRFFTPTQGLARTVTRETSIAGVPLVCGDRVFMSFAAANRDGAMFPRPDVLDIARQPNTHTAFGLGVHRCLGSNITRIEFDVVINEVLRRLPDYAIDEQAAKRYETVGVVNGWERIPFTFTPGQREPSTISF